MHSPKFARVIRQWEASDSEERWEAVTRAHTQALREDRERNQRELDFLWSIFRDAASRGEGDRVYNPKKAELAAYAADCGATAASPS